MNAQIQVVFTVDVPVEKIGDLSPKGLLEAFLNSASTQTSSTSFDPKYDNVTPLTPAQFGEFMSNVNSKTASLLGIIAEQGEPSWKQLMAAGGYPHWQQLRGIFSGLTKRVRTITGNPNAKFYEVAPRSLSNDMNEMWEDHPIFVHPVTLATLRRYFGIA